MKLAFYYHVPVSTQTGAIKMPGYLGVFIDALAREVEELTLIAHEAKESETLHCDYAVSSNNVRMVNLGFKTAAWHRELFHSKILKSALRQIEHCDILLVRSPTPLAAYFHKYLSNPKIFFMIVGDYLQGTEHYRTTTFRNKLIYAYLLINDYFFQRQIKKSDILVNSLSLFEKYKDKAKSVHLIKTTTLSNADFYWREDTCQGESLEILYTGRIDPAKGLFELIHAYKVIKETFPNSKLHIVGWEDGSRKILEKTLIQLVSEHDIDQDVIFHGRKNTGTELNAFYRKADIYVLPSYHEGFPRTIWEAMANSCPVIATRVGSIPYYLKHEHHALLIEPKNVGAIVESVKRVISDKFLRQTLIRNGYELAQGNTLEIQTKRLVETLEQHLF